MTGGNNVTESGNQSILARREESVASATGLRYAPIAISRGRGARVVDAEGREYVDLLSSAATINVGHCHPTVVSAIRSQALDLIHYTPAYMTFEPLVTLAEQLGKLTPGTFRKQTAFGVSGAGANDRAIKYSRAYTSRTKIVSFYHAYHGTTYGALSLSAVTLNMRRGLGPTLPDVFHIPFPDCYRCPLKLSYPRCEGACWENTRKLYFDTVIPPEEVAALFIEPIQGDAGIVVPPAFFLPALRTFCDEHGILLVFDEIQTGFGRTGRWFAAEHWSVVPDMVLLGKAIASGMPLSAIVARREILDALRVCGDLQTFGGTPIACQAALATLDVLRDEHLVSRSERLGQHALTRLQGMEETYELIGDVRGRGLSLGVDLVKDRRTREPAIGEALKVCWFCYANGVLLTTLGKSVLRFQPPLVIEEDDLEFALDVIEAAIAKVNAGEIPDSAIEGFAGW
jgi:4-aminobutyrate aminotransferase